MVTIGLLHNLGATVAVFSHSRDELRRVVRRAADYIEAPNGRSTIVVEAHRRGTTKSDLLILAGKIDDKLGEAKIKVKDTPVHDREFQINEEAFEKVLDDEVSYLNPRAKEYDINSVRSIYVLRANTSPSTLEKSKAVLVSSNSAFARAAFQYGEKYKELREVSSVITDFSLANMAWLKAPMGAPSLPMTEVLAFSYAALQPTKKLLNKYLIEIDRLEKQGKITERDHQLLRSSTIAHEELMRLTLGDEKALSEETINETLQRVSTEIKKEERDKLTAEQKAHSETQNALASQRDEIRHIQERLYWRCQGRARICAWFVSVVIIVLLPFGVATGYGLRPVNSILGWILTIGFGAIIIITLANLIWGTTVRDLHHRMQNCCLMWFIKREAMATGLDLECYQGLR